jgi:hypothetical protein
MASVPPTDVRVTLPSPIPNDEALVEELSIAGPGSRVLNVSDLVRFGDAPGSVEFGDGPAAAAASVMSATSLAADRCVRAIPKVWYLPGGTTREGRDLVIRLFNPFPDLAKVVVRGVSEFGAEPLPELGTVVDVPGRFWTDIDLGEIAPLLDDLLMIVEAQEGLVIPALSLGTGEFGDEASWPGTSLSATWDFPVVATDDLLPELIIANPTSSPVTVEVDAFGVLGPEPAIVFEEVAPESQLRIPLPDLGGQAYGIRVTAAGPIAAVVVAESPVDVLGEDVAVPDADTPDEAPVLRVAGTVGAESPALRWLLPGAGAVQGAVETVWLMNTSDESATVTLKPLGVRELAADKMVVRPGTTVRFRIPDDGAIASYLIESAVPVTVAWTASDAGGTAFVAGIEIDG